jgi:hypothetical protein
MSSLRRVQSSKADGARSKGPSTPAGKQRSSLNALRHGMCAKCIVLDHESRDNFLVLVQQHTGLFQPANEVEVGMIEEMCAALLAPKPRLDHPPYAMRTLIMLRTVRRQTTPVPFPNTRLAGVEQPPLPPQATDSEALCGQVGNLRPIGNRPFDRAAGYHPSQAAPPTVEHSPLPAPRTPPHPPATSPPRRYACKSLRAGPAPAESQRAPSPEARSTPILAEARKLGAPRILFPCSLFLLTCK